MVKPSLVFVMVMATGTAQADPSLSGAALAINPAPLLADQAPPAKPYDRGGANRLTLDGNVTTGVGTFFGASLALEHRTGSEHGLLVRLGYAIGGGTGRSDTPDLSNHEYGYAHVGDRWYWDHVYASFEIGAILIHDRNYGEFSAGEEYTPMLSGRLGAGAKVNGLDLGIHVVGPLFGVQLSAGFDFARF